MKGPETRYLTLVNNGVLAADQAQAETAMRLQALDGALQHYPRGFRLFSRKDPPRGLYIWGGVGRGKTLLMDIFYNNTRYARKRRSHFHEFMVEIHERIAAWRALSEKAKRHHKAHNRDNPDDPMPPIASEIAAEALLICFDEFQVSDIADAMILGRVFEALFAEGVIVVATSNRSPDDLYKDGLNRQLFLPFIDLLNTHLDILELRSIKDYRLEKLEGAPVYYCPLGPVTDAAMNFAWSNMICGADEKQENLKVKGRTLSIPKAARGAARFEFSDLCENPLGASDYQAIIRHFDTLFIDRIPIMGPERRNEAKRFVILIDAIYDSRTKLVCSANGEPDQLYTEGSGSFEFQRTASRLIEMRSDAYLAADRRGAEASDNIAQP